MLQTEYEFTLPKGYVDNEGTLHKEGIIRLATAADEILPQKDARVANNPSYLVIILLSRVIIKLGTIAQITPKVIENLFVEDLEFLENLYNKINGYSKPTVTECPKCHSDVEVADGPAGG